MSGLRKQRMILVVTEHVVMFTINHDKLAALWVVSKRRVA